MHLADYTKVVRLFSVRDCKGPRESVFAAVCVSKLISDLVHCAFTEADSFVWQGRSLNNVTGTAKSDYRLS